MLFARVCMLGLMLAAPAQSGRVQKDLANDKLKYDQADNAADRAKALGKLGHEEFAAARQAAAAGKFDEALQLVKDYNDQATSVHEDLLKTGVDPEKHSNGFRQLQISVREREHDLRELISRVGFEQREPFETVQKTLENLNQKLMIELFPRRAPNKQSNDQKNP
jgi:hypothetical protein